MQAPGHLREHVVAAFLADGVVHLAKAVQAHVYQGEVALGFVSGAQGNGQGFVQAGSIGQASRGVAQVFGVKLLAETWAEDAALVGKLREWLWADGLLRATKVEGKDEQAPEVAKFRDYFDYDEPIHKVPSHRALAVFRGRTLQILDAKLVLAQESEPGQPSPAEGRIALHLGWRHQARPADDFLRKCVSWTWKVKLSLSLERDLFTRLREEAEAVAIKVFADNLRDLLLAAPAGKRTVLGLDPGIRTGCKVAVVSDTGKVLATTTVYPHEPRKDWEGSLHALGRLVAQHGVNLIAIGNGTASRETDQLAADLIKRCKALAPDIALEKVVVSEAGASVYSASEFASNELPELDVSLRGAVSIARRLQDPLAELVKIDPKSIGVGQYQHDVNQSAMARQLDAVVEDCVNGVGVDLNTASVPLLARVSGLSPAVAASIVRWRDAHGAFRSRKQLLDVAGLGPRTFEQAAGFLRIREGDNPLDMTGVHPETYPLAEAQALRRQIHSLPELGFEEQLTSDLVAERLQHWGVEVHRGMARTGVIGLVQGRREGSAEMKARAIGLRADMDALPIQEQSRFPHVSRHAGVMHACGHDGHTAMLLAAARHLAATRDFCGTAVLIFQPAEEGRGGAQAMVAEGLFERYPMQAVFGMHNWPGLPVGSFALSAGPVMASASTFRIVIQGQGSHAALPHLGLDPVPVAAQLVMALQTILSRNARPIDAGVVSVTMLHAGQASNVIADTCVLEGTVRTFRAEVLDLIERRMRAIAHHTCAAHGMGCEFEFLRRAPPVVNHPDETAFARRVLIDMLGQAGLLCLHRQWRRRASRKRSWPRAVSVAQPEL
ncbi:hypothetical protein B566_EDAN018210 [Ephemera danica]|nr:hypothetical protein B566_EDAN018210 [Ephemera danica]